MFHLSTWGSIETRINRAISYYWPNCWIAERLTRKSKRISRYRGPFKMQTPGNHSIRALLPILYLVASFYMYEYTSPCLDGTYMHAFSILRITFFFTSDLPKIIRFRGNYCSNSYYSVLTFAPIFLSRGYPLGEKPWSEWDFRTCSLQTSEGLAVARNRSGHV
jgi:hypothetical protein